MHLTNTPCPQTCKKKTTKKGVLCYSNMHTAEKKEFVPLIYFFWGGGHDCLIVWLVGLMVGRFCETIAFQLKSSLVTFDSLKMDLCEGSVR